ncbi:MAG: mandelate racemase/muconate lactonizing enzyme family protein [Gemmatimonadota bacterium]
MKITAVDARLIDAGFRNLIITRLQTDAGITGYSEVVTKRFDDATVQAIGNLVENIGLVGKDPRQPALHFERLYRDNQWTIGTVAVSAISALEIAMWDIKGRELGRPVYDLFGGPTFERVPVYCHVPGGASPEEYCDHLAAALDRGYRVMKTTIPVYYGQVRRVSADGVEYRLRGAAYSGTKGRVDGSHNEHQWTDPSVVAEVIAFFERAKAAHGDRVELWVDCHARLSGATAMRLVHGLGGLVDVMEEPLPPEDVSGLLQLKEASYAAGGPRLAAGERVATVYDRNMVSMLTRQAVDVFQPDVGNCGGFGQVRELGAVAAMHNIGVAPHNPNGPLSVAQGLQAMAFLRNGYILETVGNQGEEELAADILHNPEVLRSRDGHIDVPTGPGLGVEIDERGLARRPFRRYYQATR